MFLLVVVVIVVIVVVVVVVVPCIYCFLNEIWLPEYLVRFLNGPKHQ